MLQVQQLLLRWKVQDRSCGNTSINFTIRVLEIPREWQQGLIIIVYHYYGSFRKTGGLLLQNQDAYIKVAGGVKLDEPAIDLAIAVSIASSFRDKPTKPTDVLLGK